MPTTPNSPAPSTALYTCLDEGRFDEQRPGVVGELPCLLPGHVRFEVARVVQDGVEFADEVGRVRVEAANQFDDGHDGEVGEVFELHGVRQVETNAEQVAQFPDGECAGVQAGVSLRGAPSRSARAQLGVWPPGPVRCRVQ
ncbi:hypothetical protein ACIBG7_06140 [Nonomuraea sp. NPDC050328]|uniref:hypothetical protein n=1 Tax=Nonomuraea sp. NPDC050328 TaxID=3364361 RepID=UPI0037AB610F